MSSSSSVSIQDSKQFEELYEKAKQGTYQDIEVLKIENVTVDEKVIQELRHLLPQLKELVYNKPSASYYSLDNDEDEEEDDDHGACGCHRHDRYE